LEAGGPQIRGYEIRGRPEGGVYVRCGISGSQTVYSELGRIYGRTIYLRVPKSENCNGEFSYQKVGEGMMFGTRGKLLLAVAGCMLIGSGLRADDLGLGFIDCGTHPKTIPVTESASQTTKVIAQLPCGERFNVVINGQILSRIQMRDGRFGYVYSYLVKRDDSNPGPWNTATPPTRPAATSALVTTEAPSGPEENEKIIPVDPAAAARILSGALTLPDATPVRLKLTRTISSADAHPDDHIEFTVLEDVIVNGTLLIPRGAKAFGTVTVVEPKKTMTKSGKLDLNIDYARLADNEKAELRAVKIVNSVAAPGVTPVKNSPVSKNAAASNTVPVSDTLVPWPAAPTFSVMHARDVTIPEGTEITVYTNGDMRLDPVKFGAKVTIAEESQQSASQAAVASQPIVNLQTVASASQVDATHTADATLATVAFRASPEGAEIIVDGKYVGDAPSTLNLPACEHTLAIKKAGYIEWQRKITVAGGASLTINPTLQKLR
jgi:hypothetical protein